MKSSKRINWKYENRTAASTNQIRLSDHFAPTKSYFAP